MYYILDDNGKWVEGIPTEDGQKYKFVHPRGGYRISYWSVPDEQP